MSYGVHSGVVHCYSYYIVHSYGAHSYVMCIPKLCISVMRVAMFAFLCCAFSCCAYEIYKYRLHISVERTQFGLYVDVALVLQQDGHDLDVLSDEVNLTLANLGRVVNSRFALLSNILLYFTLSNSCVIII